MRRLGRNLAVTYAVYAASIGIGLALTPVIVRDLGAARFGVWSLIGSLVVMLGLLDFGLGPSVIRHAASHRGRGRTDETSALAATALLLYAALTTAAALLGIAAAVALPAVVDLPAGTADEARAATLVAVAGLTLALPLGLFSDLLSAHQRYDVVNAASLAALLVYALAVAVVFLSGHGGLVELAVIALGMTVLRLLLPLPWIRRELPGFAPARRQVTRARVRALLSFSADNFVIHVASKLAFSVDVIVVGVLLGAAAAGFYGVASRLFALLLGASTAGTGLLLPALSELDGAADVERQRWLTLAGLRAGIAFALVLALPLVLLPDLLLEAWIGAGFEQSEAALALLGAAIVVHQPVHVLSPYLLARARQRPLAVVAAIRGVANVGLSIVLALAVGLWGVALATFATEAVAAVLLVPILAGRVEAGIPPAAALRAALRPVFPALLVAIPVLGVAPRLADTDTLASLAPVGALWVAAAALAVWVLGLSDDERAALRRRLPSRAAPPVLREPLA